MLIAIDRIKQFLSKPETISAVQFFLVIIIAVFSAICTYKLTMATFNSKAIAWMLTIIVEGSLTLFSFKFHSHSKLYGLVWVPYLIVSIIASQGALIGDADIKKTEKIHSSVEYQKFQNDDASIESQITTLQNRLNSLDGSDTQTINDINNKIAKKRTELRNTVSTPKTQRIRSDIQKEIDSLEKSKKELLAMSSTSASEAKNIQDSINNLNNRKKEIKQEFGTDIQNIGGVTNAFSLSLNTLHVSETNFWTLFFILLEITRNILLRDSKELYSAFVGNTPPPSGKKSIPELEKTDKKSGTYKFKKSKILSAPSMQKNNVVPFSKNTNTTVDAYSTDSIQTEIRRKSDGNRTGIQTGISNPILKKYIEVMYRTAKNNVCIWQKTIATEVGITSHQATKIIGYLKHLGIVEVNGNTKILVSKDDALQRIRKGA